METLGASGDNLNYFDPAEEDVSSVEKSKTQDGAAMFRQRASAVSKRPKGSALRNRLSISKPDGAIENLESVTTRTRSKSKL